MGVTVTTKKGQIYISFTANKQRKLFAVRPTIKLDSSHQLDTETVTIYTGNKKKDKELNQILNRNYLWFLETVERLEKYEKKKPTVGLVSRMHKEYFLTEFNPNSTFEAAFEAYIDYKRDVAGIREKSLLQYSHNFGKRFRTFLTKYKYKNVDELDEQFMIRLNKHLLDLNYSKATYTLTVDMFKNFCRYLLKKRLIEAEILFQAKDLLRSKGCNNLKDFALTIEEVRELYEFKGLTKKQAFYKDVFVFNCVAGGMRYSDLSKIKIGDVDLYRKLLHVYTQKNKSFITIPLLPLAEAIIRKYNPDIATTPDKERLLFDLGSSLNGLNERFKHIAKKFYRMVDENKVYPYRVHRQEIIETANKGHKTTYKYMYQFFKSSLCRRTFITILLEQNYTYDQIKLYTGHRSYKAFSGYAKLSQQSKANVLQSAFSGFAA